MDAESSTLGGSANSIDRSTPETKLLLACARAVPDSAAIESIRRFATEVTRWDHVADAAEMHGLLPLTVRNLRRVCSDQVPEDVQAMLRKSVLHHSAWNLRLARELVRIVALLRCRGICAVPFKGPSLACAAYGSLVSRQMADLDLLVRREDCDQVEQILLTQGFVRRATFEHRWAEAALFYNTTYRVNEVNVEVHWALAERYFAIDLDPAPYWGRLVETKVLDSAIPCLNSEDLLLALCIHGARHGWSRLVWVTDVAELLRRTSPVLDWERMFANAERQGVRRILAVGVLVARLLLEAPVTPSGTARLDADPEAVSLARSLADRLCEGHETPLNWLSVHLAIRERLRDRVRHCQRIASMPSRASGLLPTPVRWYVLATIPFTPNERDWAFLPLPPQLRLFYVFLRPLRLVGRATRAILARDLTVFREWKKQANQ